MSLFLTEVERLARARSDLKMGAPVVIRSDTGLALVLAIEVLRAERLAAAGALGRPDLALTRRRAETLAARAYDGDLARVVPPSDAPLAWYYAVADPAADLAHPLKGPFSTRREGPADLHRAALRLCKVAELLPAALVVPVDDIPAPDLTVLEASLLSPRELDLSEVSAARVPTTHADIGRLRVFRTGDGAEEHYLYEIGQPDRSGPVMARLHSACFTGDVLGSLKCDCGPQLHAALDTMAAEGAGILLYLNQEGRGIGLANKMRAYALQDQGFDTVDANHRLGFEDDERDFRLGAEMLKAVGVSAVRLMTNNPAKLARLSEQGVTVAGRVPLHVGERPENAAYLATKARRSGHLR
ncbi:MAG: GTP cyclohydrolase II [Pseudomonadota bacterium]